jgi:hypothetical protein
MSTPAADGDDGGNGEELKEVNDALSSLSPCLHRRQCRLQCHQSRIFASLHDNLPISLTHRPTIESPQQRQA